ncbi:cytochrome-c oxidase [Pseudomaricurvus alkylphenolicus]|jgi:cytochrome c oxidase subunit 3|uniref:cytochrome c oxidase subunit 3 n=1 Tax=Pseudomaricurvus alkylphenolicus TaxID=1306991 RepID=UPI001421EDD5|nr:cytochrome c oxidase subunit 3 [Pseudomaricurvus alkylphenolicus]NIB39909.1 cytochrome-c oxidase [Pseudomaricurvus alkylphenolicus]
MSEPKAYPSLEENPVRDFSLPTPTDLTLARGGLRMLFAVLGVMFALFAVAYSMRMHMGDWQVLVDPWQLWLNTAMLIAGSVAMEIARQSWRRGRTQWVGPALLIGGGFAVVFLAGQLWVWSMLTSEGYLVNGNPATSFFYLITGLHGLHIVVGLGFWAYGTGKVLRGAESAQRAGVSIELCSSYWHFLLVVWLGLFALLANT